MNNMLESRIGKYFIIAYALLAIIVFIIAFSCGDSTCNLYIVLPIMPWAFILAEDFGLTFPWAIYPLFMLLNVSVAYVVGASIEWAYNRYLDHLQAEKLKKLNKREIT
jgi:hypothetical protein